MKERHTRYADQVGRLDIGLFPPYRPMDSLRFLHYLPKPSSGRRFLVPKENFLIH